MRSPSGQPNPGAASGCQYSALSRRSRLGDVIVDIAVAEVAERHQSRTGQAR